jgi:hypothetical protein
VARLTLRPLCALEKSQRHPLNGAHEGHCSKPTHSLVTILTELPGCYKHFVSLVSMYTFAWLAGKFHGAWRGFRILCLDVRIFIPRNVVVVWSCSSCMGC